MVFIKKITGHPTIGSFGFSSNTVCFTEQKGNWEMALQHKTRQATI